MAEFLQFYYIWDVNCGELSALFSCKEGEENRRLESPKFVLAYERFSFEMVLYFEWNYEEKTTEVCIFYSPDLKYIEWLNPRQLAVEMPLKMLVGRQDCLYKMWVGRQSRRHEM